MALNFISTLMDSIVPSRRVNRDVAELQTAWRDSTYYDDAEKWTHRFWGEGMVFRRLFDQLDLSNVIELACGRGRHAEQAAQLCSQLTAIDVVPENVEATRARIKDHPHTRAMMGDGKSFRPLEDGAFSAIYCYDSMVHFSANIVEAYLKDTKRVLSPGGMALFHHSNYTSPTGAQNRHYGDNPHARHEMSQARFQRMAEDARLSVVESIVIDWGEAPDLDCVTLCAA